MFLVFFSEKVLNYKNFTPPFTERWKDLFYVTLKTDATVKQIQKTNRRANEEYKTLKTKGARKEEIEAELRRLELPIDCWESDPIRSIPNDQRSIEQVLEALHGSFIGPALGALDIYAQTLKYIK